MAETTESHEGKPWKKHKKRCRKGEKRAEAMSAYKYHEERDWPPKEDYPEEEEDFRRDEWRDGPEDDPEDWDRRDDEDWEDDDWEGRRHGHGGHRRWRHMSRGQKVGIIILMVIVGLIKLAIFGSLVYCCIGMCKRKKKERRERRQRDREARNLYNQYQYSDASQMPQFNQNQGMAPPNWNRSPVPVPASTPYVIGVPVQMLPQNTQPSQIQQEVSHQIPQNNFQAQAPQVQNHSQPQNFGRRPFYHQNEGNNMGSYPSLN